MALLEGPHSAQSSTLTTLHQYVTSTTSGVASDAAESRSPEWSSPTIGSPPVRIITVAGVPIGPMIEGCRHRGARRRLRLPQLCAVVSLLTPTTAGTPALAARTQDAAAGRSTTAGVYSNDQADRGRAIFDAKCESCHGAAFEGGTLAPALKGREFLSSFEGKPLRRMYSGIISTMPPDDVASLTESETLALVALLLRAAGYPDGPDPLARADDLNAIVVAPPPEPRDHITSNAETADNEPLKSRSLRAPRPLRSRSVR
jgi:mono/diheme cytochrome c family protein